MGFKCNFIQKIGKKLKKLEDKIKIIKTL